MDLFSLPEHGARWSCTGGRGGDPAEGGGLWYGRKKAGSTRRHIAAARTSFERWLWSATDGKDTREVSEIPPEQLDGLLASYFMAVRKPSGDQYKLCSFVSLRSNLQTYLREKGYPAKISTDTRFVKSQNAFNQRGVELETAASVSADLQIID